MKRFSDLFLASLALLLLGVPILFLIWQVRRKLVARSLPLPLDSINNLRSFVGIDNLVDFIVTCITHPQAANQTFLVSDGEDLSTPDLIRRMARAMDRPARLLLFQSPCLWPAPPF